MIESRCGIMCSKCEFKSSMGCAGCLNIVKPFWGNACPVKSCVEKKQLTHCGECSDFPCDLAKSFAFDEKQGDNGKRLEQCRCWSQEK
ncbi:DUF3795 domain-containing protein [Thomasclavelia sp.]